MAKENVKRFLEEVSANKELQEKIAAIQKGYEPAGKSEEEVFEDIVLPIAKEAGYEFTMSEYKDAQHDAIKGMAISEEELENVSGGAFCILVGFGDCESINVNCSGLGIGFGCH